MARAKEVRLANGRRWPRKGDALKHFKEMLGKYRVGERVHDDSDHDDLANLLQIYDSVLPPEMEGKIGSGIAYFEKGVDFEYPGKTQCFFVVRRDGTRVDFSYIRAIECAAEANVT